MTKEEMQAITELLKPINDKLNSIDTRLNSVEQSQTKIELKIENQVDRAIKVTMEGHTDLNRKMDKTLGLENRVERLENKMTAVEFAIQKK